ncbi:MAG: CoA transferase, partial [Pandoraea sp.]|nr:CoA transferase [Pandoraea sp.]
SRVRQREVLVPMLADMVRKFGKDVWIDKLEAAGVPCGPINTLPEVFANPQVKARGMEVALPHPSGGVARVVASPMKMSETPPIARTAPPTLGQHSDDILRERLGFDDARIEQLRAEGVV